MDHKSLKQILRQFEKGQMDLDTVLEKLKTLPYDNLEFAKIDNHRCIRTGVPEVIYCAGKTVPQVVGIVNKMSQNYTNIMGTRVSPDMFAEIRREIEDCRYHEAARIVIFYPRPIEKTGQIAVVCAGTSDIPVAEEACITAETMGNRVSRIYDVGVAGLHRLLDSCEEIYKANVVIVIAGMEGALASVVGGLVAAPVIGVPTSIGYGASFGGIAALLSMLNSCATGVSVVNIDNGFGAGCQASLINKLAVGAHEA